MAIPASYLVEIVDGINAIDGLKNCDVILSSDMGSPEQSHTIIEIIKKIQPANPNSIYICDPAMGARKRLLSLLRYS